MSLAFAELYKHNLWANLRLIDFCAALTADQLEASAPGTYGTVRNTLVHIVFNEENYVSLISGAAPEEPLRVREGFPGFEALRQHAQRSGEKLVQIASQVDPGQILRGSFGGDPYALPVTVPLIQAINHATEHRAQVAIILSQQGLQPPVLDGWTYGDEDRKT